MSNFPKRLKLCFEGYRSQNQEKNEAQNDGNECAEAREECDGGKI